MWISLNQEMDKCNNNGNTLGVTILLPNNFWNICFKGKRIGSKIFYYNEEQFFDLKMPNDCTDSVFIFKP